MFPNLRYDFQRVYTKTSYQGKFRKIFATLGQQGFQAILGYRMCRWLVEKKIPLLHLFIQRCAEITTGISIPPEVVVGKGLMIPHFGGLIINSNSTIGEFCTISHGVTLGNKMPGGKSPVIGNHVYICAGAKVLGEIHIGDHCIIGANSVVVSSIPPNSVVAGIPAKVIRKIDPATEYREFWSE